jgi:hypothetical protein
MKNILTAMRECDAILQTLIHDIGSHQVQAADLAIRLRTAANLLDPPECPGSVSRPHGMFQTVVHRSTVPDDSDDASALCAQLQQELDRYHSGGKDLGGTFREVEPAAVRVGDRIRILDITLYYRQWTEFIVHRIERYSGARGIYYFVSRDDGMRKLIYAVGTHEPYLTRTYSVPVGEQAFTPEQQHGADPAQSRPGQSESH